MPDTGKFVLGSRSPRRLELLAQIVPAERIVVLPPLSSDEAGFEGLHDWASIETRLREIARTKCDDVAAQLANDPASGGRKPPGSSNSLHATSQINSGPDNTCTNQPAYAGRSPYACVVAADTVILGIGDDERLHVLGQPPDCDDWAEIVRGWFIDYYFGRTHIAATALCVATSDGRRVERVVRSDVTFRGDGERFLDWYLATSEPRGKAGGYAIQGAGSLFVEKIEGSLSNIVGLPLVELVELFDELQIEGTPTQPD